MPGPITLAAQVSTLLNRFTEQCKPHFQVLPRRSDWGVRLRKWCRRGESNPRPRDYETLALPLSYAGVEQFFMLRIRLRMCQGVIAKSRTRTAGSCSICFSGLWADMRVHSRPPRNGLSPINFSTTVPLTRKVPKSILIGIEPLSHVSR